MKILVINGPNLNFLGKRDKKNYSNLSLSKINSIIEKEFPKDKFVFFHSNLEGEIVTQIQQAGRKFTGIIINPGAYAHTSVAIRDALADYNLPKIEIHLSNLSSREDFRQVLLTAAACNGYVVGFKQFSYCAAVFLLHKIINKRRGRIN
jgi:3-dehydroquinate dehydratase II